MSLEMLSHVWNMSGVTADEKLLLIWIANHSGGWGGAVMVDPHGMGEFICSNIDGALRALNSLTEKGLVRCGTQEEETSCYIWIAYDGEYDLPVDWTIESKNRSKRITALIERDGPACSYCGRTPVNYEVDHFVPRAKGGKDRMDNLVLACAPCNRRKRDIMPEQFLRDRPRLFRTISTNLKYLYE
jgi:5-methylcytosine-specific restriction endonuclease McrA